MLSFENLSDSEREAYFRKASEVLGLNASIIEKDFWVCWMLSVVFQLENGGKLFTFKGGTSLSKAYKIIKRFSEDIDISIDKNFLGFSNERDPENAGGTKKREKLIGELAFVCKEYIHGTLLGEIRSSVERNLTAEHKWSLELDSEDPDGQTILFLYPAILKDISTPYVHKRVAIHKSIYFRSAWAQYNLACPGTLKLMPAKNRREELAEDYLKMREMFFEAPPKFENILQRIQEVEEEINIISLIEISNLAAPTP